MQLLMISQCKRDLDFKPHNSWPLQLPAYARGNLLLSGFDRSEGDAISLVCSLAEALYSIYPSLKIDELARLISSIQDQAAIEELFECYGLRYTQENLRNLRYLATLPQDFQHWVGQKDVSLSELQIIYNTHKMGTNETAQKVFETIVGLKLSKSQGLQALEHFMDLLEMGHPTLSLLEAATGDKWIKRLYELRYPLATRQDQQLALKIKTVPWPLKTQARWARQGDISGLEIKIVASNKSEFEKQLVGIQQIKEPILNSLFNSEAL